MLALEETALGGRHPLGREACADALELGHALEGRGEALRRHHRDDGAAVRAAIDKPHGAEAAQCLAHRSSRDLVAGGERGLLELLARLQDAGDDVIRDRADHLIDCRAGPDKLPHESGRDPLRQRVRHHPMPIE
jgi:hypothetical protein